MKKLTPNIAVKNIKQSVAYYQNNFDFTLQMAVSEDKSSMGAELDENKEYIWAMMVCGGVTLMLQRDDNLKEDIGLDFFDEIGSSITLYIEVEDVEALYAKVSTKVNVIKTLETTWYGAREFYIQDLDGYIFAFATVSEPK